MISTLANNIVFKVVDKFSNLSSIPEGFWQVKWQKKKMHLNQMHNYGKASNVMMSRNGHIVLLKP